MAANFPSTPSLGDIFEAGEYRYEWNGSVWTLSPLRINKNVTLLQPSVSSTVIDLSSGHYHKVAPTYNGSNTVITFANIPAGASKWSVEVLHDNNGYNIPSNASIAGTFNDFAYTHFAPVASCEFQPDGSSLIFSTVTGATSLYGFIPTPWTLSQIGAVISFTLDATNLNPVKCLRYNNDGTRLYAMGGTNRLIEYGLDVPYYPIATRTQLVSNTVAEASTTAGFTFKPDGTRLYIVGAGQIRTIYSYTLSTPWDTSTLVYDNKILSVSLQDSNPYGVQFNDTGTELYMTGNTSDRIFVYTLSAPWEIDTATFSRSTGVRSGLTNLYFSPKGTKLFTTTGNTIAVPLFPTFPTSITWPVNVEWTAAPTSQPMQNLIVDFYTNDGGTTIYGVERYNRNNTLYGE